MTENFKINMSEQPVPNDKHIGKLKPLRFIRQPRSASWKVVYAMSRAYKMPMTETLDLIIRDWANENTVELGIAFLTYMMGGKRNE